MPAKVVVNNVFSRIYGIVPPDIEKTLKDQLQYTVQDYEHVVKNVRKGLDSSPFDGHVYLYWAAKGHKFYTGMMSNVLRILDDAGFAYTIDDRRIIPPRNLADMKLVLPPGKFERPYQNVVVASMIKATRGIMQAATGAGKTFMTTKIIGSIKSGPFIFFVPTKDLLDQAHECLSDCLTVPIGKIGDNQCDIRDINVVMVQTAVKAIKRNDPQFKIADYSFDEEDTWDDAPLDEPKAVAIDTLMRGATGVYLDECVSGDTMLVTDKGIVPIRDVVTRGCSRVMTQGGFEKITGWRAMGCKRSVIVRLSNGTKIRCSHNHPFGTLKGWKAAKNLQRGDVVVCADVGRQYTKASGDDSKSMCLDTKTSAEPALDGKNYTMSTGSCAPCVNVGVANKFSQLTKQFYHSSPVEVVTDTLNISCPTTSKKSGASITLTSPQRRDKHYLEHVLETHALFSPTPDQETEDYMPTIVANNWNGLDTKVSFFTDLVYQLRMGKIQDSEKHGRVCDQDACHPSQRLQRQSTEMTATNILPSISLIQLGTLGLRGGSVMMEVIADSICHLPYTPKDGQGKKLRLQPNGSTSRASHAIQQEEEDQPSTFQSSDRWPSKKKSNNMSRRVWHTSLATVTDITEAGKTDLYDIGVENKKSFFGNGILVHNCHHAASRTCQTIMEACSNAYWRFGGSATPFREDGAEKMIQALFGKIVMRISASWLIRNKYLVKPYIFNVRMNGMHGHWDSYPQVYKHYIVDNDELNELVARLAIKMQQEGIPTLILVKQYPHGNAIKKMIPDAPFIRGDMPRTKRRGAISGLRDGSIPCAIATTLADEGLDVERLGCVMVAGGGKSITRVYQRVGRALRSFKENGVSKERAIVFLFHHEAQFLDAHGRRVANILKDEPEFVIVNSNTAHIMDDLNDFLNPGHSGSIFG